MREPLHDRLEEGLDVRGTYQGMDSRRDGDSNCCMAEIAA